MYIIRPTTINDSMLISTDVPETDGTAGEWAVGTPYTDGQTVRVTTTGIHRVYECLTNVTGGASPNIDVLAAVPKWLDIGATTRWKPFDTVVNSQTSQATAATWVLKPGLADSIAVLNMDATDAQIVLADQDQDLITNGTDWTGATGTTQPTGWDKVGTPADYLIDGGALKITADDVNEGMSKTFTVTAGTEYQLLGIYRNTAGDIAQYSIRDMTNGVDIVATTDLPSSTADAPVSVVFTTPASVGASHLTAESGSVIADEPAGNQITDETAVPGCTSIKISLMAKTSGDIVWFDTILCAPTVYNLETDLVSTINVIDEYTYWFEPIVWATSITKLNLATADLPPYPNATVTVTVTNTGGTAKIGAIIVGLKLEIGKLKPGPQPGLESFSTLTEDPTFGTWSVTRRAGRKTLTGTLIVKNTIIDFVLNQMALLESTLLVWVGRETYECLTVYGFYRQFRPTMFSPNFTEIDFEVRGVI